jgi:cysteine-rich repeat protein
VDGPPTAATCGNGLVERPETCDDGNRDAGDGCSPLCTTEPFGGGGGAHDCALTWRVGGGPADEEQTCRDGDSLCDRDAVSGQCSFQVSFCFNASSGSCTATDVVRVQLATDFEDVTRDAVLEAMAGALARSGSAVGREDGSLALTPPASLGPLCGSVVLPVAAGSSRDLGAETSNASGATDQDQLRFLCR